MFNPVYAKSLFTVQTPVHHAKGGDFFPLSL